MMLLTDLQLLSRTTLWGLCLLASASACDDEPSVSVPQAGAAGSSVDDAGTRTVSFGASGAAGSNAGTVTGRAAAAVSGSGGQSGSAGGAGHAETSSMNAGAGGSSDSAAKPDSTTSAGRRADPAAMSGSAGAAGSGTTTAATGGSAGAAGDGAQHGGHIPTMPNTAPHPSACGAHAADPRDASMSAELVTWNLGDDDTTDLLLPRPVRDWLSEGSMLNAHGAWHGLRQCQSQQDPNVPSICRDFPNLVAESQECENVADGYNFLVMHRHMLQDMRRAFPQHKELFAGFQRFPFERNDVPEAWRERFGEGWSQQIVQTARILENIEDEAQRFENEGALGQFIQCGGLGALVPSESIHSVMHEKWNVDGSPVAMNNFYFNLGNAMFWQLHGWLDRVWERYRTTIRLAPDDPELQHWRRNAARCICWRRHFPSDR